MKKHIKFIAAFIFVLLSIPFFSSKAYAAKLDEIINYSIDVKVNQDATLNMKYHIEWKVLNDSKEGPLTWVKIGIPNKNYVDYKALTTDTIKKISYYSSGGSYIRIDLNRSYKKGEIVIFEFELNQDYMYEMNKLTEGETVYEFIPGWFDDIDVDHIEVRWSSDKVESHSTATENDGWLVWNDALKAGEKLSTPYLFLLGQYCARLISTCLSTSNRASSRA